MKSRREKVLERIHLNGLLFDGAMGSLLDQSRPSLPPFDCGERLVIEHGDAILEIHQKYLRAGADVVKTCTFGATPHKLSLYNLERKTKEINFNATLLARQAALEFPGSMVAGSMGPTGLLSIEKRTDFDDFYRNFYIQAECLLLGGADILLLETCNDMLETRAGIISCRDAMAKTGHEAVLAVSFTVDQSGRILMGTTLEAAAITVDQMGVDLIGMNCSMGPDQLLGFTGKLLQQVAVPLLVMPNRGLPENVGGKAVFNMPPVEFAEKTMLFRRQGFHCLGGCCGSTPECIQELRRLIDGETATFAQPATAPIPALTDMFEVMALSNLPKPIIVGERMNYHGSKKFRQAVENADLDTVLAMAHSQVEAGATVLDVCLATRESQKQIELIQQIIPQLGVNVPRPLMVDSTDFDVLDEACRRLHGRGVLNSCNLENEERCRRIMVLARRYGQMLVCLPLLSAGIPPEPTQRLDVAHRLVQLAGEEGLAPADLIFDPLTLTLGAGRPEDRDNGMKTLATLDLFKSELKDAYTIMGVSNVSYGLPPALRLVLNNVLLYYASQKGLDFAIFNPLDLRRRDEISSALWAAAEDVLFNRRPDSLERFLELAHLSLPEKEVTPDKDDQRPVLERLANMIINRRRDGFIQLLEAALQNHAPLQIIEEAFLPAMRETGRLMEERGLPLPFVLETAGLLREGMDFMRRKFADVVGTPKGRMVLATVKGDVHDIGKNLVRLLLEHNGFDVVDLGTDTPSSKIVEKAVSENADLVGLSALLVSTSREMRSVVELLHRGGYSIPVLIGGAAVNRSYAMEIGIQDGSPYTGGVFYARDAFQGLKLAEGLVDPAQRVQLQQALVSESLESAKRVKDSRMFVHAEAAPRPMAAASGPAFLESDIRTFCVDVKVLIKHFDFEHRCGRKLMTKAKMEEEFYHNLLRTGNYLLETIRREFLVKPMGIVGILQVKQAADGLRLHKDGQEYAISLSPTCYSRLMQDNGEPVLPLLVVTLGGGLSEEVKRKFDEGDYLGGYLLSTIGAELAEEMAELTTATFVEELGVPRTQVVRYSPGYPIWPSLSDQRTIFDILGVPQRIGVRLSEAFQMIPEFSVSAGLVHKVTVDSNGLPQ